MRAAVEYAVEPIAVLEEKFMRLLEVDRDSREFEALFREVDALLDVYAEPAPVKVASV